MAALSLVGACLLASAQEAAPGPKPLALRPAPGSPVLFVYKSLCTETEKSFEKVFKDRGQEPIVRRSWTLVELSLEVGQAIPGKGNRGILGFGAVRQGTVDPLSGPMEELAKDVSPGRVQDTVFDFDLAAFEGVSLAVEFDRTGAVTEVTGIDAAAAARVRTLGLDKDEGFTLKWGMDPKRAMEAARILLPTAPFPARPPEKGAHWETTGRSEMDVFGYSVSWRQTLTAGEAEGDVLPLEGTGKMSVRRKESYARDRDITTKDVVESSFRSEVRWSLADGLPLSASTEAVLDYKEYARKASEALRWRNEEKAALDRVKAWPSGRKPAPLAPAETKKR